MASAHCTLFYVACTHYWRLLLAIIVAVGGDRLRTRRSRCSGCASLAAVELRPRFSASATRRTRSEGSWCRFRSCSSWVSLQRAVQRPPCGPRLVRRCTTWRVDTGSCDSLRRARTSKRSSEVGICGERSLLSMHVRLIQRPPELGKPGLQACNWMFSLSSVLLHRC